ncbi:hypothetical protein LC613_08670 [Nostoc sphaeroides CHAB 2801]|uniref:hypothetical protein n=1 Tax=Nostoc sphaeroides TaxID=446679 RepID=UPI001E5CC7FE|nr:hypothetical protein [Nostoc sphaeroides]MCC5628188.1 hypothetical protein [Nostoc sphaeroides CHAB 2801]
MSHLCCFWLIVLQSTRNRDVYDGLGDRYLWMDLGWDGECLRQATRYRRIHGCLVHIAIRFS